VGWVYERGKFVSANSKHWKGNGSARIYALSTLLRDEPGPSPAALREAEQTLIGAVLIDNSIYALAADYVTADDFSESSYARAWLEIDRKISLGTIVNPLTLQSDGVNIDHLMRCLEVGRTFIRKPEDVVAVAESVAENSRWRQLHAAALACCSSPLPPTTDDLAALREQLDQYEEHSRLAIQVHNASHIEVTKIPPRGWLLGVTFCRKFLSGLIGSGAAGKTTVRYVQYLALASRRNLTGEKVHVRSRILIVCLEDDLKEIERRIGAAMLHHGVTPGEVDGWLSYCCPRGLKLLQQSNGRDAQIGGLYIELRRIVAALKIDIVSIDPFIKAAGVDENDNNLIDQACVMLAMLGDEFNCAIDLNSHARKGNAAPGDAERDRGASAKKDAGRLMRTLTPMSTTEAELFDIAAKDQPAYVRVDDAKVNITPRSTEAMWFRLVDVPLGNRDDIYPNGDNVQTAERWFPPDTFAKLDQMTVERILNKIEAGPYEGGRYSPAANAKDRGAWPVVQEFCPGLTDKQAKTVIAKWIQKGVLVKRDHQDPKDRDDRPSLFVGKRPGDTWED
jgi:hypothetical protein